MGMLPILVVLACVVFLWGMVNYSSFVAKRKQISDTLEARLTTQQQLGALFAQISDWAHRHALSVPDALLLLPDLHIVQPKKTVESWCVEAEQFLEKARQIPALAQSQELRNLTTALDQTQKAYLLARKRHTAAVNGYNWEAQHMPSKIIARLFGFRPV
jgi:hypothetical protein